MFNCHVQFLSAFKTQNAKHNLTVINYYHCFWQFAAKWVGKAATSEF